MYFYLIGIDHKSARLEAREAAHKSRKEIAAFLNDAAPGESALLSTCNRLEIYGVAPSGDDAFGAIAHFSRRFPGFSRHAYTKTGEEQVFRHTLRLASGLESQINGEEEILAQLDGWRSKGALPIPLKALWARAMLLSNKIRAASGLNAASANIATLVLDDITKRIRPKKVYEGVVVGTGKVAGLFAKHAGENLRLTFVAHKNYQQARMLAEISGGAALRLADLSQAMARADVLIGATSSPHHVLKREDVENFAGGREQPLDIYDLAVPRDVEPAVRNIDRVRLYDLDTLGHLFDGYNKSVKGRVELASGLIEDVLEAHREVLHDNSY